MSDYLTRLTDDALIAGLSAGLKASIDRLLSAGEPRARIEAACVAAAEREAVKAGDPHRGRTTVLAARAYLDRVNAQ